MYRSKTVKETTESFGNLMRMQPDASLSPAVLHPDNSRVKQDWERDMTEEAPQNRKDTPKYLREPTDLMVKSHIFQYRVHYTNIRCVTAQNCTRIHQPCHQPRAMCERGSILMLLK